MAVPKRKKSKAWKRHKLMLNYLHIVKKNNFFILKNEYTKYKSNLYDIFII